MQYVHDSPTTNLYQFLVVTFVNKLMVFKDYTTFVNRKFGPIALDFRPGEKRLLAIYMWHIRTHGIVWSGVLSQKQQPY